MEQLAGGSLICPGGVEEGPVEEHLSFIKPLCFLETGSTAAKHQFGRHRPKRELETALQCALEQNAAPVTAGILP